MDYFGVDLDHIIHCFEEKLIRDKYELSLDIRDFLNPTEILTTAKSNEINTLAVSCSLHLSIILTTLLQCHGIC